MANIFLCGGKLCSFAPHTMSTKYFFHQLLVGGKSTRWTFTFWRYLQLTFYFTMHASINLFKTGIIFFILAGATFWITGTYHPDHHNPGQSEAFSRLRWINMWIFLWLEVCTICLFQSYCYSLIIEMHTDECSQNDIKSCFPYSSRQSQLKVYNLNNT